MAPLTLNRLRRANVFESRMLTGNAFAPLFAGDDTGLQPSYGAPTPPSEDVWILLTGFWNDDGVWDDDAVWTDGTDIPLYPLDENTWESESSGSGWQVSGTAAAVDGRDLGVGGVALVATTGEILSDNVFSFSGEYRVTSAFGWEVTKIEVGSFDTDTSAFELLGSEITTIPEDVWTYFESYGTPAHTRLALRVTGNDPYLEVRNMVLQQA